MAQNNEENKTKLPIEIVQAQVAHYEQLLHNSYKKKGIIEKQLKPLQLDYDGLKDNIERLEGAIASCGDVIKAMKEEEKKAAKK